MSDYKLTEKHTAFPCVKRIENMSATGNIVSSVNDIHFSIPFIKFTTEEIRL